MNVELREAALCEKDIVRNLMQYYFYDFSEFNGADVTASGQFGDYPYLGHYWHEEERIPFLLLSEQEYLGFVLVREVNDGLKSHYSIAEFFILKKYRRSGAGKSAAFQVFDWFKGNWEVTQIEKNMPAREFWRKTIDEYTQGSWEERREGGKYIQMFKS